MRSPINCSYWGLSSCRRGVQSRCGWRADPAPLHAVHDGGYARSWRSQLEVPDTSTRHAAAACNTTGSAWSAAPPWSCFANVSPDVLDRRSGRTLPGSSCDLARSCCVTMSGSAHDRIAKEEERLWARCATRRTTMQGRQKGLSGRGANCSAHGRPCCAPTCACWPASARLELEWQECPAQATGTTGGDAHGITGSAACATSKQHVVAAGNICCRANGTGK